MREWLTTTIVAWCRLPAQGTIAELDMQIDKLRLLRDSYQASSQERMADREKDTKQLCLQ
jgi:hypothetical protein